MQIKTIKKPQIRRINKGCAYSPCHKGLEDCTFCYCPFYPCRNDKLGEYIFIRKTNRHIWSCQDCSWIHKKKAVDAILSSVRKGNIRPYRDGLRIKSKDLGIIILAHGSKVKKTNVAMRRIIGGVKKKLGLGIIESSYLQLCGPNLHINVKKLVKKGCKRILLVPFFLFTGNHVGKDIPKAVAAEAKLYKDVKFVYAKSIGNHPGICDIVSDCIREALLKG